VPEFQLTYEPDHRQAIASSWPESINDHAASEDWGWKPQLDLEQMTEVMLEAFQNRVVHIEP
jgi:nucleoside-diphosphate-sugar epimerase